MTRKSTCELLLHRRMPISHKACDPKSARRWQLLIVSPGIPGVTTILFDDKKDKYAFKNSSLRHASPAIPLDGHIVDIGSYVIVVYLVDGGPTAASVSRAVWLMSCRPGLHGGIGGRGDSPHSYIGSSTDRSRIHLEFAVFYQFPQRSTHPWIPPHIRNPSEGDAGLSRMRWGGRIPPFRSA